MADVTGMAEMQGMAPIRAWVVEDSSSDARLIADHLPDVVIELRASTMQQAVQAFTADQQPPDVLLADLHLPDSSGLATLDRLLDVAGGVPVVVVTGDARAAHKAVQVGAHDSLDKDSLQDLARAVRNAVVRSRRATRGPESAWPRAFDLELDLLVVLDEDGQPVQVNDGVTQVLGWRLPDLTARGFMALVHPDDVAETAVSLSRLDAGVDVVAHRNRFRAADGEHRWLDWRVAGDPASGLRYAVARDVTDLMVEHDRLRRTSMQDEVTGIANRRALLHHLAAAIEERRQFTVLYCALDGFRHVNEQVGHVRGDAVLRAVAERVRPLLRRRRDLLARHAGDEFVIVADRTTASRCGWLVERVLGRVTEPVTVPGHTLELGMSIGIAENSGLVPDAGAVLSAAGRALATAKRAGRNQARRWGPQLPTGQSG